MNLRRYIQPSFRIWVFVFGASLLPAEATAQQQLSPPEQALLQTINALQTGTENWARYSPPLRQLILAQTSNTGAYIGLAQLGMPTSIHTTQFIQLPAGHYYTFRTQFNMGALDWQVVADLNGNLWGIQFQPAAVEQPLPSKPSPAPSTDDDDDSKPAPTTKTDLPSGGKKKGDQPKTADEACKLYPNLC